MHRVSLFPLFLIAALSLGSAAFAPVRAQEAAPADAAQAAPQEKTFGDAAKTAGPAVWVCAGLAVLVVWFTVEGFLKFRVSALAPLEQVARLRELIDYGAYQDAWEFCAAHRTFLCTVVGAGLERLGRGPDAVEYTLEEASTQQAVLLKTNMNYLSVIGVVAPMIGLTGTVIGMIRAFDVLGASGVGDLSLASAIGEVLTSTASGLLVAIPGFVFYYVFKAKAQTAVMLADAAIYRLFENIPYGPLTGAVTGTDAASTAAEEPS